MILNSETGCSKTITICNVIEYKSLTYENSRSGEYYRRSPDSKKVRKRYTRMWYKSC